MIHLERTACTSLFLFTYKTESPFNTAVPFALLFKWCTILTYMAQRRGLLLVAAYSVEPEQSVLKARFLRKCVSSPRSFVNTQSLNKARTSKMYCGYSFPCQPCDKVHPHPAPGQFHSERKAHPLVVKYGITLTHSFEEEHEVGCRTTNIYAQDLFWGHTQMLQRGLKHSDVDESFVSCPACPFAAVAGRCRVSAFRVCSVCDTTLLCFTLSLKRCSASVLLQNNQYQTQVDGYN